MFSAVAIPRRSSYLPSPMSIQSETLSLSNTIRRDIFIHVEGSCKQPRLRRWNSEAVALPHVELHTG